MGTLNAALADTWAAASSVAAVAEAIGMLALPDRDTVRLHLDERPVRNRAAVIVWAAIAPWPVLLDLMRRH